MPALGSQNNEWERLGSQNRAWERMEMGGAFKGVSLQHATLGWAEKCIQVALPLVVRRPGDDAVAPIMSNTRLRRGLEVTGGRGLGYNEHLGGSPAVEGLFEAADGGEIDGANRSVGKESVGAVEMVFSAKAAGGKRLSKTFSKTNLKNMRRKVAPSSMAGKRLETVVSSISTMM
ncbi:hypothetical protein ACSQ67_014777 [Phaseolus vulgaris]